MPVAVANVAQDCRVVPGRGEQETSKITEGEAENYVLITI